MDYSQRQIEIIKSLIRDTLRTSEKAHKILFENYRNEHDEFVASIFINKAISISSCCKSIYYSNLENLENKIVENIFLRFDVYVNEFLNNISTGHSHQWTDIEFNAFKDSVSDLLGDI